MNPRVMWLLTITALSGILVANLISHLNHRMDVELQQLQERVNQ